MTLAPGHFHAALVQKDMPAGVDPRVYVYAPLGEDLVAHMARVAAFNSRAQQPTTWELDVRAGDNYLARFLREQPGHAVVIAGRNQNKIDLILASATNAAHVLADKPWIVTPEDFDKLIEVRRQADLRDLLAWDMMTERFEITTILQRALIADREIFGDLLTGTPDEPALCLESVHYLKKRVDGVPLRRPAWWFNAEIAGTAITDVGTHLADLSMWLLFPEQTINYRTDIRIYDANQWPTPLSREQFAEVTGLPDFPASLRERWVSGDLLLYQGNGTANYTLCGAHVRIGVAWDFEAPAGHLDTQEVVAMGSRAKIAVKPTPLPRGGVRPELSVTARLPADHPDLLAAVAQRCELWQAQYPGVTHEDQGNTIRIRIPERWRTGHEAHFACVIDEFLRYLRFPRSAPSWEWPNLLAKYHITTSAAKLARRK
jgi:predicted dehydrogenase